MWVLCEEWGMNMLQSLAGEWGKKEQEEEKEKEGDNL